MGKNKICWIVGSIIIVIVGFIICYHIATMIDNEKNRITEGVIIDKSYSAAFTIVDYVRSGKIMVPVPHYYPARYSFQLRGEKNGQIVTYWCKVSKEDYDEYRIGSYYRL